MTQNAHVMLMAGNEELHRDNICCMHNFLRNIVGYDKGNLKILYPSKEKEQIKKSIETFIERYSYPSVPLVFVYNGHGERGHFLPNGYAIGYSYLASMISQCLGDSVFINDSCYSGSVAEYFKAKNIFKQGMIITSCGSEELSWGGTLLESLVRSYIRGEVFKRKRISREDIWYEVEDDVIEKDGRVELKIKNSLFETPLNSKKKIQHPIKRGKTLDYLLMPEEKIDEKIVERIIMDGLWV